jgi:hypothetical protein
MEIIYGAVMTIIISTHFNGAAMTSTVSYWSTMEACEAAKASIVHQIETANFGRETYLVSCNADGGTE